MAHGAGVVASLGSRREVGTWTSWAGLGSRASPALAGIGARRGACGSAPRHPGIGFTLGLLHVPVVSGPHRRRGLGIRCRAARVRAGLLVLARLLERAEHLVGVALIALGAILLAEQLL